MGFYYPGIENVKVLSKEGREDGLTVYKMKYKHLNIMATCNKPSKQAIENYNRVFNQCFNEWANKKLNERRKAASA